MTGINLATTKKVFFIGIGGIGISAIARMMLLEGKDVSGSDLAENEITQELTKLGAKITIGQGMNLIPGDTDLVIYTIAVHKYDSKFFNELKKSKIKILSYPEVLGLVTEKKYTIAVSGTHGKTTTTAMIAKIFMDAGRDPSVIVGSLLKDSKSNLIVGKSNFFIVEACEYERSFLNIKPKILVITNVEADHLDYYKNLKDIQNAFRSLMSQTEHLVIFNGKDVNEGTPVDDYIKNSPQSGSKDYTKYLEKVPKLSVPGEHNRMNAAAAYAVGDALGIGEEVMKKSLESFSGTWRRLEMKGKTSSGTIIYDDYAHHPTEIKASIQALRELYPDKKITVLFQPHLFSRTRALFDDFARSWGGVERVLLLPIYPARETDDGSVSSEKLAEAIRKGGGNKEVKSFSDFPAAEGAVAALPLGDKDVFVTMGAGEAYKVANKVFKLS